MAGCLFKDVSIYGTEENMATIRKLVTTGAVALMATWASSADAHTLLLTDPGGNPLAGSTTIRSTARFGFHLEFAEGRITCNSGAFDVDVNANTSSPVITVTTTGLTFTSCTDTFPVVSIPSCALSPNSPLPTAQIYATSGTGGRLDIINPVVRCSIAGSTTSFCYYSAPTMSGTMVNATSRLTFSSGGVTNVGGSGSLGVVCGTGSGSVNWIDDHVVQGGTNRTVTIGTL
jgi:hypothetical protein